MFGKYNGFVSKARVSACMYFLVKWGGSDMKNKGSLENGFFVCLVVSLQPFIAMKILRSAITTCQNDFKTITM
jgi:hypothetical protein